ncbi:MAG: RsmE family RNA methyltransferase [Coriobacteriia bacterium]|nr:RsmE family RNA methyltransferase [Coriobacteriia bacterium]
MSLQHFYLEDQVIADQGENEFELRLLPEDAKHLQVLRMGPGEHIAVVDAAQDYFECEIVSVTAGIPTVRIAQHLDAGAERPQVLLFQGLAKGDKMETVIRHATELGVAGFVPLACARSVMKLDPKKAPKKIERWQSIAKSAATQSGQPRIPEVLSPMTVKQACGALAGATCVCVCWEEAPQTVNMRQAIEAGLKAWQQEPADARIAVVVGPEGGLTSDEVDLLLAANPAARLVSLGPSILRTETAGIVAPALALYELGGLGGRA